MKIKILHLFLIGSIVSSVIFIGCKKHKEGEETATTETGTFTDNRDGKTYKWVKIGQQIWMAENLSYTGNDIQHITEDTDWVSNTDYDGWCSYNNSTSNSDTYGILYQWGAAKTACPDGWHLPTDEEWTQLENYLKDNGYSYDGVVGSNGIAKSLATDYGWQTSNTQGAVGNTDYPEFRNKTGFSALPGGSRKFDNGIFLNLGRLAYWWSNTDSNGNTAFGRLISSSETNITRFSANKLLGASVRCIKN